MPIGTIRSSLQSYIDSRLICAGALSFFALTNSVNPVPQRILATPDSCNPTAAHVTCTYPWSACATRDHRGLRLGWRSNQACVKNCLSLVSRKPHKNLG